MPGSTYTYAVLELSRAAFDEIAGKLRAAGYDHLFDGDTGAISMRGIGIAPDPSEPVYRHVTRGSSYRVLGEAELQSSGGPVPEGTMLSIYVSTNDGKRWARPHDEFADGRFERVDGEPR